MLGYLFCDGTCAVHSESKMGFKARWLFYYGYLALQNRDASVHRVSSALRSSLGGIMGWIASPYSSLGSPRLSWTSIISVSMSHQLLTHPPFGGLTVQVHLQLRLFSLQLFVFPVLGRAHHVLPGPAHPQSTTTPPPFRHPQSATRAHYIRDLGIKQLMSPDGGKKLRSGTWKLWESFFVMEMEQTRSLLVNLLSLYLNPCTGKIHHSFSRSREGRERCLKISLQSHEIKARCWGAAALLQSFYGAGPFRGPSFRSLGLHSPGSGSSEKPCLRSAAVRECLHTCRWTSRTQHVSTCHERSLSVQLSGRDRPVPFSKVTMKFSSLCLIF